MIYVLIAEGEIETALLRPRNSTKGVRLVSKSSLDSYIARNIQRGPIKARKAVEPAVAQ